MVISSPFNINENWHTKQRCEFRLALKLRMQWTPKWRIKTNPVCPLSQIKDVKMAHFGLRARSSIFALIWTPAGVALAQSFTMILKYTHVVCFNGHDKPKRQWPIDFAYDFLRYTWVDSCKIQSLRFFGKTFASVVLRESETWPIN